MSNCIREAVNYQHTYRLYGLLRAMSCLLSRVSSVSDAFAGGEGEPTVEEELLEPVSSTCCSASSPSASAYLRCKAVVGGAGCGDHVIRNVAT